MQHVDIVFDGPPGPEAGRFVEVEDSDGNSIKLGEWIDRDRRAPGSRTDWALRIEDPRALRQLYENAEERIAALTRQRDGFVAELTRIQAKLAAELSGCAPDAKIGATAEALASFAVSHMREVEEAQIGRAEELDGWVQAASKLDPQIITPAMLDQHGKRVSDDLAAARVERDAWMSAALRLGRNIRKPSELVDAIDSLQDAVRTSAKLCNEHAERGKDLAKLREQMTQIGVILIPQIGAEAATRHPLDIERAAREHARNRDAIAECAKVLGSHNLYPHTIVERVTDLKTTLLTRDKQLDEQNAITKRTRELLGVMSPKLDFNLELEEIRTMILVETGRDPGTTVIPRPPLRALVVEVCDELRKARTERDEMAAEMTRDVTADDVANAVDNMRKLLQSAYDRDVMRGAIINDIRTALFEAALPPGSPLIGRMLGGGGWGWKVADAACDRLEGLIRMPVEAADSEEDNSTIVDLDEVTTVLTDALADRDGEDLDESLRADIIAEVRGAFVDEEEEEAGEIELSEAQLDKLADKIAARMKGGR